MTLASLGGAYGDLGDAAQMRVLLERALAIKEAVRRAAGYTSELPEERDGAYLNLSDTLRRPGETLLSG